MKLYEFVLQAMISWVPLDNQVMHGETVEAARDRYTEIAKDIVSAVNGEGAVFKDDEEGVKSVILLAALAAEESHYVKDIHTCKKGGDGEMRKVNGKTKLVYRAWGLWQVHGGQKACTRGTEEQLRLVLDIMRDSRRGGVCASKSSRCIRLWSHHDRRLAKAMRYLAAHPFEADKS